MKQYIAILIALDLATFSSSNLHADAQPPSSSIQQKLDSIVLPSIDFKNESIPTAVETLRKLARENSKDGKGVNIFLRVTDISSSSTVTYKMTKPTLKEAVTELAKQSGMTLKIDPIAVSLN